MMASQSYNLLISANFVANMSQGVGQVRGALHSVQRELQSTRSHLKEFGALAGAGFGLVLVGQQMTRGAKSIAKAMGTVTAAIVQQGVEFEKLEVQFKFLYGQRWKKMWENTRKVAVESLFTTRELFQLVGGLGKFRNIDPFEKFKNRVGEMQSAVETMADLVALTPGKTMSDMIRSVSQMLGERGMRRFYSLQRIFDIPKEILLKIKSQVSDSTKATDVFRIAMKELTREYGGVSRAAMQTIGWLVRQYDDILQLIAANIFEPFRKKLHAMAYDLYKYLYGLMLNKSFMKSMQNAFSIFVKLTGILYAGLKVVLIIVEKLLQFGLLAQLAILLGLVTSGLMLFAGTMMAFFGKVAIAFATVGALVFSMKALQLSQYESALATQANNEALAVQIGLLGTLTQMQHGAAVSSAGAFYPMAMAGGTVASGSAKGAVAEALLMSGGMFAATILPLFFGSKGKAGKIAPSFLEPPPSSVREALGRLLLERMPIGPTVAGKHTGGQFMESAMSGKGISTFFDNAKPAKKSLLGQMLGTDMELLMSPDGNIKGVYYGNMPRIGHGEFPKFIPPKAAQLANYIKQGHYGDTQFMRSGVAATQGEEALLRWLMETVNEIPDAKKAWSAYDKIELFAKARGEFFPYVSTEALFNRTLALNEFWLNSAASGRAPRVGLLTKGGAIIDAPEMLVSNLKFQQKVTDDLVRKEFERLQSDAFTQAGSKQIPARYGPTQLDKTIDKYSGVARYNRTRIGRVVQDTSEVRRTKLPWDARQQASAMASIIEADASNFTYFPYRDTRTGRLTSIDPQKDWWRMQRDLAPTHRTRTIQSEKVIKQGRWVSRDTSFEKVAEGIPEILAYRAGKVEIDTAANLTKYGKLKFNSLLTNWFKAPGVGGKEFGNLRGMTLGESIIRGNLQNVIPKWSENVIKKVKYMEPRVGGRLPKAQQDAIWDLAGREIPVARNQPGAGYSIARLVESGEMTKEEGMRLARGLVEQRLGSNLLEFDKWMINARIGQRKLTTPGGGSSGQLTDIMMKVINEKGGSKFSSGSAFSSPFSAGALGGETIEQTYARVISILKSRYPNLSEFTGEEIISKVLASRFEMVTNVLATEKTTDVLKPLRPVFKTLKDIGSISGAEDVINRYNIDRYNAITDFSLLTDGKRVGRSMDMENIMWSRYFSHRKAEMVFWNKEISRRVMNFAKVTVGEGVSGGRPADAAETIATTLTKLSATDEYFTHFKGVPNWILKSIPDYLAKNTNTYRLQNTGKSRLYAPLEANMARMISIVKEFDGDFTRMLKRYEKHKTAGERLTPKIAGAREALEIEAGVKTADALKKYNDEILPKLKKEQVLTIEQGDAVIQRYKDIIKWEKELRAAPRGLKRLDLYLDILNAFERLHIDPELAKMLMKSEKFWTGNMDWHAFAALSEEFKSYSGIHLGTERGESLAERFILLMESDATKFQSLDDTAKRLAKLENIGLEQVLQTGVRRSSFPINKSPNAEKEIIRGMLSAFNMTEEDFIQSWVKMLIDPEKKLPAGQKLTVGEVLGLNVKSLIELDNTLGEFIKSISGEMHMLADDGFAAWYKSLKKMKQTVDGVEKSMAQILFLPEQLMAIESAIKAGKDIPVMKLGKAQASFVKYVLAMQDSIAMSLWEMKYQKLGGESFAKLPFTKRLMSGPFVTFWLMAKQMAEWFQSESNKFRVFGNKFVQGIPGGWKFGDMFSEQINQLMGGVPGKGKSSMFNDVFREMAKKAGSSNALKIGEAIAKFASNATFLTKLFIRVTYMLKVGLNFIGRFMWFLTALEIAVRAIIDMHRFFQQVSTDFEGVEAIGPIKSFFKGIGSIIGMAFDFIEGVMVIGGKIVASILIIVSRIVKVASVIAALPLNMLIGLLKFFYGGVDVRSEMNSSLQLVGNLIMFWTKIVYLFTQLILLGIKVFTATWGVAMDFLGIFGGGGSGSSVSSAVDMLSRWSESLDKIIKHLNTLLKFDDLQFLKTWTKIQGTLVSLIVDVFLLAMMELLRRIPGIGPTTADTLSRAVGLPVPMSREKRLNMLLTSSDTELTNYMEKAKLTGYSPDEVREFATMLSGQKPTPWWVGIPGSLIRGGTRLTGSRLISKLGGVAGGMYDYNYSGLYQQHASSKVPQNKFDEMLEMQSALDLADRMEIHSGVNEHFKEMADAIREGVDAQLKNSDAVDKHKTATDKNTEMLRKSKAGERKAMKHKIAPQLGKLHERRSLAAWSVNVDGRSVYDQPSRLNKRR